jgi:hypothetical protein
MLLLQGAAAAGLLGQQRLQSCLLGASLLALGGQCEGDPRGSVSVVPLACVGKHQALGPLSITSQQGEWSLPKMSKQPATHSG